MGVTERTRNKCVGCGKRYVRVRFVDGFRVLDEYCFVCKREMEKRIQEAQEQRGPNNPLGGSRKWRLPGNKQLRGARRVRSEYSPRTYSLNYGRGYHRCR